MAQLMVEIPDDNGRHTVVVYLWDNDYRVYFNALYSEEAALDEELGPYWVDQRTWVCYVQAENAYNALYKATVEYEEYLKRLKEDKMITVIVGNKKFCSLFYAEEAAQLDHNGARAFLFYPEQEFVPTEYEDVLNLAIKYPYNRDCVIVTNDDLIITILRVFIAEEKLSVENIRFLFIDNDEVIPMIVAQDGCIIQGWMQQASLTATFVGRLLRAQKKWRTNAGLQS